MRFLVFLCAMLVALAGVSSVGGESTSVRDANRTVLVSEEGPDYDPEALVAVTYGAAHDLQTVTVAAEQAIEMHLDHLDAYGIDLADLDASASSEEPAWPLVGKFHFREKGWFDIGDGTGARCPTVEPKVAPEIEELFGAVLDDGDESEDTLGIIETDVSEFATNLDGRTLGSSLQYWTLDEEAGDTATDEVFRYTGWTLRGAFYVDYFCREPSDPVTGFVAHESYVEPEMERLDES